MNERKLISLVAGICAGFALSRVIRRETGKAVDASLSGLESSLRRRRGNAGRNLAELLERWRMQAEDTVTHWP